MMKIMRSLLVTPATCVAVFCLMLSCSMTALAAEDVSALEPDGPTASDGRPLYTEETRPDFPVFNSLVGEENFLSITGPNGETVTDFLELQMGMTYDAEIAYNNNGNPRGVRTHAIATETIVKADFPETITDERTLTATISAQNSQPLSVSSSVILVAAEPMALEIIPGSVQIINNNPTNNAVLSEYDFTHDGAPIGTNSMIGIVMYGPENAGSVVFQFRTVSIGEGTIIETSATNSERNIAIPASTTTTKASTEPKNNDWTLMETLGVIVSGAALVMMITYLVCICREARKRR